MKEDVIEMNATNTQSESTGIPAGQQAAEAVFRNYECKSLTIGNEHPGNISESGAF